MLRGMTKAWRRMTRGRTGTIKYMSNKAKLGASLAGAVEYALGAVPYNPPVDYHYTEAVRDAIRSRVPANSIVDVILGSDYLNVSVSCDDACHEEHLPLI